MRIYVASSWRNAQQPAVVQALQAAGHDVYDFKADGFRWADIDPLWQAWSPDRFRNLLGHPFAARGFARDMRALSECDVCILLLPCGRSAHLEAGWAVGAGKRTIALLADGEPELMYRMVHELYLTLDDVVTAVGP